MNTEPLSAYHFIVDWGGANGAFSEISGLSIENEVIEYRNGNSTTQQATKMPGLRKYSNITLKRGLTKGDTDFYKWLNTVNLNKVEKRNVTISLLNENHEPVRVWKVRNAWPCKISGPHLKADGNEVAIETIELAHEGLEIEDV
ncbi:MAG: phage tail protein [Chitinophagaceae bacterium]